MANPSQQLLTGYGGSAANSNWATWNADQNRSPVISTATPYNSVGEPAVMCMLSSTTALVFYVNQSNSYGYAVVATISGDSVSWGTPSVVTGVDTPYPLAVCSLSSTQAIIAYAGVTGSAYAMIINISGTTPSGATPHIVGTGTNAGGFSISKTSSTQAIMTWVDNVNKSLAVALSVSSSIITVGTILTFSNSTSGNTAVSNISSTAAMVFWLDQSNSKKPTAMIINISGTTLSTNTSYIVDTVTGSTVCEIGQLSISLFGVGYSTSTNTYAAALSLSGTTITVGTPVIVSTVSHSNATNALCVADSTDLMYNYIDGSGNLQGIIGTISGTTITLNNVVQIASATQQNPILCQLDTQHILSSYNNSGGSPLISGIVLSIV